jgi:hypothetical protein
MTEASVSFAGNLTDHPELRHTTTAMCRSRDPGHVPGGQGPQQAP